MQFKEFLYFQKNDRRAIVFLLLLVVIAVALFFGIGGHHSKTEMTASDSIEMKKSPLSARGYGYNHGYYEVNGRRAELFPFDPNTADSTQLLRLGLSPWQVRNIYKYRAKGGVYRQPSDFARIYGLTVKQYRQLEPYIHISDDYSPASRLAGGSVAYDPLDRDTAKYPVKIRPTEKVYVNSADTQMLKRVPGIGSYFARQIVNYRERLGGFYSVNQLKEIDDFPDEALKFLLIDDTKIRKININKLTLNQLKRHPYINFFQAKDITDYRRMRGNIINISQLRLLKDFPPSEIERLLPYIEY